MSLESAVKLLGGRHGGEIIVLTGAGLSAASGIPTFRGPEGYWTVGSREYHPQELATFAAWQRMPREVWRWYLYRRGVCRGAQPNEAHLALARAEQRLRDRLTLISQNVDGLHLRAGNSRERTFEIHGNIDTMRCTQGSCSEPLTEMSADLVIENKGTSLDDAMWDQLRCPRCDARTRPHVLWFDEYYDEEYFRAQSSLESASRADAVITVGTSGATNLPHQVVAAAVRNGAALIDINSSPNPFSELAEHYEHGARVATTALEGLPELLERFL